MNVAVMNGNDYRGRSALSLDSMPEEEAADTERAIRPVMHPGTVDTKAITALHQQAYAALRGGSRAVVCAHPAQPERSRRLHRLRPRKMPALMCGADNNYLALTWRQIHTIEKAASRSASDAGRQAVAGIAALTPRNLAARRHAAIHHEASGQSDQLAPDHLGRQLLSRARGRLPRRLAAAVQGDRTARARQSGRAHRRRQRDARIRSRDGSLT